MQKHTSRHRTFFSLFYLVSLSLLVAAPALADMAPAAPYSTEDLPSTIFLATVITTLIELPVFVALGFRTPKAVVAVILANAISVPMLYVANFRSINVLLSKNIIFAEAAVMLFESVFLVFILKKQLKVQRIVLATILANLVSWGVGYFMSQFL